MTVSTARTAIVAAEFEGRDVPFVVAFVRDGRERYYAVIEVATGEELPFQFGAREYELAAAEANHRNTLHAEAGDLHTNEAYTGIGEEVVRDYVRKDYAMLRDGKLQGWARSYAEAHAVLRATRPAATRCPKCGEIPDVYGRCGCHYRAAA